MSHNALARTKQAIAAETQDADTKRYLAHAAFLAKVAEGDRLSWNAQAEEAKAKKAAQKFPFQRHTFAPSHTFQPQLATSIWAAHSCDGW